MIQENINKCPKKERFINYINGEFSNDNIVSFEQHLKKCTLCNEALQGYKMAVLINEPLYTPNKFAIKDKELKTKVLTLTSWAAVALILLGLFFVFRHNQTTTTVHAKLAHKTLTHKTNTSYWYIGNNKTIALNDNVLKTNDLDDALAYNLPKKQILVQVENNNIKEVEQVLLKIKLKNNIPIYTFSKKKQY